MLAFVKNLTPFFLYAVWIGVFVASLFGRVQYGLFFLVPLLPLQNVMEKLQSNPLGKDVNDFLILAMLIGWIIGKMSRQEKFFNKTSFNIVIPIYFLYTYSSLVNGSMYLNSMHSLFDISDPRVQYWKNLLICPLIFWITYNGIRTKENIIKLIVVMCAAMLLMNFYNVRQVTDLTSWVSRSKITGTFVWLGANEVAAFYATYTFVLLGLFSFTKKKMTKFGLLALMFTNAFILLFLFSRGAYLSAAAAFLLFCLVRNKKLIIPLVLILIFWQAILPESVIQRVTFSETEGELDVSAQTRLVLWEQSIIYFKENPLFGIGLNVFTKIGLEKDTHNVFLRTLAEQGIVGTLLLLLIFLISLNRGWRLYKRSEDPFFKGLGLGFACCVLATIIGNFFGDRFMYIPLAAFYWAFLGMVEFGNLMIDQKKGAVVIESDKKENNKKNSYRRKY